MGVAATRGEALHSLQQLRVRHDELLPVNEDQGHFSFGERA